jgi:hypothetical protein
MLIMLMGIITGVTLHHARPQELLHHHRQIRQGDHQHQPNLQQASQKGPPHQPSHQQASQKDPPHQPSHQQVSLNHHPHPGHHVPVGWVEEEDNATAYNWFIFVTSPCFNDGITFVLLLLFIIQPKKSLKRLKK